MHMRNGLNRSIILALVACAFGALTGCDHGIEPPLEVWLDTGNDDVEVPASDLPEDSEPAASGDAPKDSAAEPTNDDDTSTQGAEATDTGQPTDSASEPEPTESEPEGASADAPSDTGTDTGEGTGSESTVEDSDEAAGPKVCLILSEVIEGSSKNKGVELLNCGDEPLPLEGYSLCTVFNDESECGKTLHLEGSLEPWAVLTVCYSGTNEAYLPLCDFTHALAYYNGDDRLVVNGPAGVMDVFGELATPPEGNPWMDATYRRCDFAPFDGGGLFELSAHYSTHGIDDFSDFGLPPDESVACVLTARSAPR